MNPNEQPPKDSATLKAERDKRNHDRLAAAVTPQGIGYSGRRVYCTPPVDHPLEPCNFKKWISRDSIAIEQACFVLLGFEPPELWVLKFVQDTYNPSHEPTWEAPPDYHEMLQSLRVSVQRGNISWERLREGKYSVIHVTLPDLVRWAKAKPKGYAVALELESIIAEMGLAASDTPAQDTATPAPVVTVQVTAIESAPYPAIKKEGYLLKRSALVKKYVATWPDIDSDLNHASENGLSEAAKGTKHGDWFESAVLAWGEQRGKRQAQPIAAASNSIFNLPGTKYSKP